MIPIRRLVEDELQDIRDTMSSLLSKVLPNEKIGSFKLGASYAFKLYME